ncbi:hypothetical protein LY78DRAFT_686965 [Colletotrichum sublineola]|nr:hypothetical protein LY78DRAFT_686965 [Colletotrichum sublineola]
MVGDSWCKVNIPSHTSWQSAWTPRCYGSTAQHALLDLNKNAYTLTPGRLDPVKSLSQRLRVNANRRDEPFVNTLCSFVKILPVRAIVPSGSSTPAAEPRGPDFASIARAAFRKAMAVFVHGTVPFDRILDTAINYRISGAGGIDIWDLPLGNDARMHLSWRGVKEAENPYDVSPGFFETPSGCLAQIWCLTVLYGPDACRSLLDVYMRL